MKNKKKLGLTTLIFIALIAGAITGIIINYCIPSNKIVDDFIVSGLFYVVGQGFIRLMRMLVVPLVFCSIVCGSMAVGDTKKLGSVGLKTMLFIYVRQHLPLLLLYVSLMLLIQVLV